MGKITKNNKDEIKEEIKKLQENFSILPIDRFLDQIYLLMRHLQMLIYDDKIWRTIDKVYETRWDCRIKPWLCAGAF
jgi:hypothetical protein